MVLSFKTGSLILLFRKENYYERYYCNSNDKNESENIVDCLVSIKDLDRIIVIDIGSTDNTAELPKIMVQKFILIHLSIMHNSLIGH